ncbi:ABC transporter permease [Actinomyces culturomici]|uniref:ABC transporter permease n=1 Tax=Actinomyces culturomici TaxID=1926276 RepID=UPI000E205DE2|nr:ABC transporter permease [Actinomyces culturomici]
MNTPNTRNTRRAGLAAERSTRRAAADVRIPTATAIRLEMSKTRRLWIWPIALVVVGIALVLSVPSTKRIAEMGPDMWPMLLLTVSMMAALISPILVSVIASRLTDIEHLGGGWTMSATMGIAPGRLCRIKLAVLTAVLVPAVALEVGLPVLVVSLASGRAVDDPATWALYTAGLLAVDVAACGLYLLLAAVVDNQIICVGLGFLGSFIAIFSLLMPPALARLIPWGYWACITSVRQIGDVKAGTSSVIYTAPEWPWVIGFLIVAGAVFTCATRRLDRIER